MPKTTSEKVKVSFHLFCQLCGTEFFEEFDKETLLDDLSQCSCPKCGADWTLLSAEVSR
ncbi:unnamed protein product [marine sediment metagenome]|uniref:Uncharacterized protein n=1 Tax=marine sediment metagenome TaxID=412755 RepID=X1G162_9ZZZZ